MNHADLKLPLQILKNNNSDLVTNAENITSARLSAYVGDPSLSHRSTESRGAGVGLASKNNTAFGTQSSINKTKMGPSSGSGAYTQKHKVGVLERDIGLNNLSGQQRHTAYFNQEGNMSARQTSRH